MLASSSSRKEHAEGAVAEVQDEARAIGTLEQVVDDLRIEHFQRGHISHSLLP